MENFKKIKVILHRGSNQIGGVCTEIATANTRIFVDFGSPLEGEGDQSRLDIDGLTFGAVGCDGVFLTHYHGDHVGEIPRIMSSIPVYMESTARKILEVQQEHKKSLGQIVWATGVKELIGGEPVIVKDLNVTPIKSDHSACNSLMYLVEGCGKRILITGDYRLHGYYAEELVKTFKNLGKLDLMITEGTTITRDSCYSHDEKWVEQEFAKINKKYKYVFLLTSSSNIGRIAAFSRTIPEGKYMLVDQYQEKLIKIYDADQVERLQSCKVLHTGNNLIKKAEKLGFGMAVRANDHFQRIVKNFFEKYPEKTCLVYSMWSGYKDCPSIKKMLALCPDEENVKIRHASGHVTKEDLEQVIETIKPAKLIIHHTAADKRNIGKLILPGDTELVCAEDGRLIAL